MNMKIDANRNLPKETSSQTLRVRWVGSRRIFKPAKIRWKLIREKSSSNNSTLVKRVVVTIVSLVKRIEVYSDYN